MSKPEKVTVYPTGVKVEVVPGKNARVPWPDHLPVPKLGIFEWTEEEGGVYRPVIKLQPVWVRSTEDAPKTYGLGISYSGLRRLMIAGFVERRQITPGQWSFNLQSFYQHIAQVKADENFWTGKNLRRYLETAGSA